MTAVGPFALPRPAATIRLRLTALYGGLFVAVGVLLLTITYGLFARQLQARGRVPRPETPVVPPYAGDAGAIRERIVEALAQQRAEALSELLTQSVLALALVSVVATALGWVMAGRVLGPLREITAAARRLSTHNLGERINLRGPRDELKELADTIDAMLGRLAAAFEAQRRFVANASHELRTPLTVQRAAVDVALARPSLESLLTMARRIHAATRRHEHLIASLLALARSERGVERYEPVDLAAAVRDALAAVAADVELRGLRLTQALAPAPLAGDPVLLERLAANLVENAVRHNAEGGWIDVRTETGPGSVRLRVANSGARVAPEAVAGLFEPFRRHTPDRAGGAGQGYGLGLSIVAAIAHAHRGRYAARARDEGGLDVSIVLPRGVHGPVPGAGDARAAPTIRA
ncbi:HAMP domain-containing histidine kinase [Nonomuraea mesophila]|uniref:histidine kinase n=1 Tax=Nonomuraea mesophila TaxID=2530382 RepID=A0A4R5FF64_9ACTN|nr:HAMP domain-containing sensor histidine kinase [Nonomuraea mesophila]TDE48426.1 HAMP domain-containing histidine kinase [Nonomuraea mesophila]